MQLTECERPERTVPGRVVFVGYRIGLKSDRCGHIRSRRLHLYGYGSTLHGGAHVRMTERSRAERRRRHSKAARSTPIATFPEDDLLAHFGLRGWLVIAESRDQILQKSVTVGDFRAPSGHLIQFLVPRSGGQTLRMDDPEAMAGDALTRLLLFPTVHDGGIGGPA